MILQNLILPQTADTAELFVRSEGSYGGATLELRSGETVSFAAYFNYFSLSKWMKYTVAQDLRVFLGCEGMIKVTIDHHVLEGGSEKVSELFSFESDGDADVALPTLPETGFIGVSVTSLSERSTLSGGGFRTDTEPSNNIRMAVNICTYKREQEVAEKVGTMLRYLDSAENGIRGNAELFIVDNGNTLKDVWGSDAVHLIPNRNLGGSGGFTRGMTEIMRDGRFTHIVMNDDDASFHPESLYRTWSFLSFLREEYKDAQIGGAMIAHERPGVIYESGAQYSERGLFPKKSGLDLTKASDCLLFDSEDEVDYFGWWYLAMPCSRVKEIGYPLPLFIKEDDVEYGIRKRSSAMITLNGVSVRHGSFESKFSASNFYYYARNRLVIGCATGCLKRRDTAWMLRNALFEAVCYRYGCAEMMLRGVKDFMKGPEFVFDHCSGGMAASPPTANGRTEDLRKEAGFEDPKNIARKGAKGRMITMNGLLLPRRGNIETSPYNMDSSDFYRVGRVLYTTDGADGFIAERSIGRTMRIMLGIAGLRVRMLFSFGRLRERYRSSRDTYSSEENWERLFGK